MTRIFSLATAVFVLALFLFAPHPAFASSTNNNTEPAVVGKIKNSGDFNAKIDTASKGIVNFLRKIGLLLAVVMLVWAGLTFAARGGNPQALLDMKGRLIAAAVGIFLVLGAESVVNFFTGIFGLQIDETMYK